ncbi:hypothetical protein GLAREA_03509 [Glarea lozoyensis ATCC 20868]|uniref:Indole-diterpene biosynthesis protein PaxU n=1 Tax=Glarea lozoyensis (strain ATCC 20868 / MF5171) TaxID=1116229 RepID=S3CVV0_GLAL2|nr:uncharacterized protein GLAREA_03509 [Glarea lozoyensis ATCC 20868]EPE30542.1 hypothetical protein GLAREA_03509 [Glarea lozoyensis ATCC 20868]
MSSTTFPLSFMKKLGPLVSIYQPPDASQSSKTTTKAKPPRFIIIAGWTDAKPTHLAKYILKYQTLYPAAQILLLRSTMSCILRPSQIGPAMKPAAIALRAAFQTSTAAVSSPPLVIHIFSNGGSSSIAKLYDQYAALAGLSEDTRLPPHVTIFDSAPGLFHISNSIAFISVSFSPFQTLLATPLLYLWAILWSGAMALGLLPDLLGDTYKSHNHHEGNGREVRRVYVYSEEDKLSDFRDVEKHHAEAGRRGFETRLEMWRGSRHVEHARGDGERYWGVVRRCVES